MSWAEDEGIDSYDGEEIAVYIEAMQARRKIPYIATVDDFEDLTKETSPGA